LVADDANEKYLFFEFKILFAVLDLSPDFRGKGVTSAHTRIADTTEI